MKCNIGLQLDYRDINPVYFEAEIGANVAGVAEPWNNEMWVFIDAIAFYKEDNRSLILRLSLTVIHELIHLCGVDDENMTDNGVKLATYGEM